MSAGGENLDERIKALRKELGLTQQEFADRLHVNNSAISNYEAGSRKLSNAMIASICREFGVSRVWLLSGEGEMFPPKTRREALVEFFGRLAVADADDFRVALVSMLSELEPEEWQLLERMTRRLIEEAKTEKAPDD